MVTEFLKAYTSLLASHPESIAIETTPIDEGFEEITIYAHPDDVGKLIGKEGRMINAIKTVISGCKAKGGKNYRVNVKPA
jgi:predicted RNA-binding protein YlqC (UPF0109 family)